MSDVEAAKRAAAYQAVADHFRPTFTLIGIGSGTTVVYIVEAIKQHDTSSMRFVPTGSQSLSVITSAGLTALPFTSLPPSAQLDINFDGADEVDADLNCIKGGGACLFQEKLVALRSRKFVCVADYRKDQARLLSGWKYIPIEVAPIAAAGVLADLRALGAVDPVVRKQKESDEPLLTDQGFNIVDAPFPGPMAAAEDGEPAAGTLEPGKLAKAIRDITGVLEVGLFTGVNGEEAAAQGLKTGGQKPVAVYFGMEDGSVKVRTAKK